MILFRILYFVFFGWWIGALAAAVAFLLCAIFIGLPIGTMIFNRLPSIITLAPIGEAPLMGNDHWQLREEVPMLLRIIYFFVLGWEIGILMLGLGYFLIVTVIGAPLGVIVLNYLPLGMTLSRRYT